METWKNVNVRVTLQHVLATIRVSSREDRATSLCAALIEGHFLEPPTLPGATQALCPKPCSALCCGG